MFYGLVCFSDWAINSPRTVTGSITHSLHLKTLSSFDFCNLNFSGFSSTFLSTASQSALQNPSHLTNLLILECSSSVLTPFLLYLYYLLFGPMTVNNLYVTMTLKLTSPALTSTLKSRLTNLGTFLTLGCLMSISTLA